MWPFFLIAENSAIVNDKFLIYRKSKNIAYKILLIFSLGFIIFKSLFRFIIHFIIILKSYLEIRFITFVILIEYLNELFLIIDPKIAILHLSTHFVFKLTRIGIKIK